mmetsp:Transcript_7470/g.9470  ORF Transcript_7470/g.9470 Transcript_7470/m.9470 type:complete len:181 (+) Transcript_7470:173-715(+)
MVYVSLNFGEWISAPYYFNVFVGLGITLLIPACGYVGAKNLNHCLLMTNCVCSGLCSVCTLLSILGLIFQLISINAFESFMELPTYSTGFIIVSTIIYFALFIFFSINTHAAMTLSSRLNNVVVVHVPAAPVEQTTKIEIQQQPAMMTPVSPVMAIQPAGVAIPIGTTTMAAQPITGIQG